MSQRPKDKEPTGFEQWLTKIACWPHEPPKGAGLDYVIPIVNNNNGGDN